MCNGDNDDLEFVDHVNEVVAECTKPEFPNSLVERLSCKRMLYYGTYGCKKILLESVTKPRSLLVEVCDSFFNLSFGGFEKARQSHFLRARSRANTSSAGTASIFPALYSA